MSEAPDLSTRLAAQPLPELLRMFLRPADWRAEALDAARAELRRRGIDPNAIGTATSSTPMHRCPICFGDRLVEGEFTGDGENSFVVFRPLGLGLWGLLCGSAPRLGPEAFACRDCGLTWGSVDPGRLDALVDRQGGPPGSRQPQAPPS